MIIILIISHEYARYPAKDENRGLGVHYQQPLTEQQSTKAYPGDDSSTAFGTFKPHINGIKMSQPLSLVLPDLIVNIFRY